MPVEVIMPKVDMDMASGRITTWHVGAGDTVGKGDALFSIETDKAAMEIEAADAGTLHHLSPEGTEVAIGEPVAWLYAEGEAVDERPGSHAPADVAPSPPSQTSKAARAGTEAIGTTDRSPDDSGTTGLADADARADPTADDRGRVRATPRARSLARSAGLDLGSVRGSGPRGRIGGADVRRATGAATPMAMDDADTASAPSTALGSGAHSGDLAVTRDRGGEGTPVVLIHGFASDSSSWAPLEAHLDRRPLIRIDLPGHGRSPKRSVEDFDALVAEVRGAFDALGVERAHLVGHSLGGALCLALADTRPQAVASLVLIAPAGLGPDIDGSVLGGICRASRPQSLGPWLRTLVADTATVTDAYVRLAMAAREQPGLRAAQADLAEALFPDGVQAFDLRPALHRIAVPARIVWGRRDRIIPWNHALGAPGRVALHLFDEIGHMPQLEAAEAVARIVRSAGP